MIAVVTVTGVVLALIRLCVSGTYCGECLVRVFNTLEFARNGLYKNDLKAYLEWRNTSGILSICNEVCGEAMEATIEAQSAVVGPNK